MVPYPSCARLIRDFVGLAVRKQPQDSALQLVFAEALVLSLMFFQDSFRPGGRRKRGTKFRGACLVLALQFRQIRGVAALLNDAVWRAVHQGLPGHVSCGEPLSTCKPRSECHV